VELQKATQPGIHWSPEATQALFEFHIYITISVKVHGVRNAQMELKLTVTATDTPAVQAKELYSGNE